MSRLRTKPAPVRNIPQDLHNIWLANKRKKDAEKIMELAVLENTKAGNKIYPTSKPTIEKALLYGHCLDDNLRDLINSFFTARKEDESEQFKQFQLAIK